MQQQQQQQIGSHTHPAPIHQQPIKHTQSHGSGTTTLQQQRVWHARSASSPLAASSPIAGRAAWAAPGGGNRV